MTFRSLFEYIEFNIKYMSKVLNRIKRKESE